MFTLTDPHRRRPGFCTVGVRPTYLQQLEALLGQPQIDKGRYPCGSRRIEVR